MIDIDVKQFYRLLLKYNSSIVGVKKNFWNVYEVGFKITINGEKSVETHTLRPV